MCGRLYFAAPAQRVEPTAAVGLLNLVELAAGTGAGSREASARRITASLR